MEQAMDKVLALMEDIGRYLTLLKVTDFVDIAGQEYESGKYSEGCGDLPAGAGPVDGTGSAGCQIYSQPRGGLGHSGVDHSVPAGDPPDTGAAG